VRDFIGVLSSNPPRRHNQMKLVYFLSLLIVLPALACGRENERASIKLDQVGYPTDAPKIALVSAAAQTFQVKRSIDNVVMLEGNLSASGGGSELAVNLVRWQGSMVVAHRAGAGHPLDPWLALSGGRVPRHHLARTQHEVLTARGGPLVAGGPEHAAGH